MAPAARPRRRPHEVQRLCRLRYGDLREILDFDGTDRIETYSDGDNVLRLRPTRGHRLSVDGVDADLLDTRMRAGVARICHTDQERANCMDYNRGAKKRQRMSTTEGGSKD